MEVNVVVCEEDEVEDERSSVRLLVVSEAAPIDFWPCAFSSGGGPSSIGAEVGSMAADDAESELLAPDVDADGTIGARFESVSVSILTEVVLSLDCSGCFAVVAATASFFPFCSSPLIRGCCARRC